MNRLFVNVLLGLVIAVPQLSGLTAHGLTPTPTYRLVALTGQQAPGIAPGVVFSDLSAPQVNEVGVILFESDLAGPGVTQDNDIGVWREFVPGTLFLAIRTGDQAPGLPTGVVFEDIRGTQLNDAGRMAFDAELDGPGVTTSNSSSIWSEGPGGLDLVLREGSPTPGLPNFRSVPTTTPLFNLSGEVSFYGQIQRDQPFSQNDTVIFSNGGGSLKIVAREGVGGVDTTLGFEFTKVHSDSGHVAFADLRHAWSDRTGSLAPVASEFDPAPGTPPGTTFSFFGDRVAINGLDQVAFKASVQNSENPSTGGSGIWSEGGGNGLALVARSGIPAPGAGSAAFSSFSEPVINDDGQVAFRANLGGAGVTSANSGGIWSEGSGSLSLVARAGDVAPGAADGAVFESFIFPAINGNGRVAFRATLTGPSVTSANDEGLWVEDLAGNLAMIAREGWGLDVDDGPGTEFRTISQVFMSTNNGNEDGRSPTFNELGLVAFRARFTDGSMGIFATNVAMLPEPTGALMLTMAAVFFGVGRRCQLQRSTL